MSLDPLFDRVRGVPPPAPFAPATEIRRLGRRRTHRQALTAGACVLAVAGVGTGAVATFTGAGPHGGTVPLASSPPESPVLSGPPSPGLSEPPSPAPSGPPVSSSGLLSPGDLGPGDWRKAASEIFEGPDTWYWADACTGYTSGPALAHQAGVATTFHTSAGRTVLQVFEEYESGWGARSLADVRAIIARCATVPPPPGEAPLSHTIMAAGFAGDESMLIRTDAYSFDGESVAPEPDTYHVVVVRVGDRVSTVRCTGADAAYARNLGVRLAALMR